LSRRETVLKHFEEQKDYMDTRVKSGIELYRKGYANLKFTLPDGTQIKNLKFKATQKSHDFNFGCNMFLLDEFETEEKNKIYRKTFPEVFNYAVAPFYWDDLEPEKGNPRYEKSSKKIYRRPAPDLVLEYCHKNNIRVKGHCLVYDGFTPTWLRDKSSDEIKKEVRHHLSEISQRYGDTIKDWDIVNEMLNWPCYGKYMNNSTRQFRNNDDYVKYPFKVASMLPFDRKFINEATGIWENFKFDRSYYYLYLKTLMYENVEFDGIGMQFHQFCPRENEDKYALDRYNPMRMYDVLDTYAKFDKPLQISEITIASYNGDEEDMLIQAELLTNMYKIWFSHEKMDGIVYWNLVDGYTFVPDSAKGGMLDMNAGENKYGGALFYNDLSPKPAWKALKKLVNEEWHTEGEFYTNDNGIATFKGFKGIYEIEFEYNGKNYKKEFHLDGRYDFMQNIVIENL